MSLLVFAGPTMGSLRFIEYSSVSAWPVACPIFQLFFSSAFFSNEGKNYMKNIQRFNEGPVDLNFFK